MIPDETNLREREKRGEEQQNPLVETNTCKRVREKQSEEKLNKSHIESLRRTLVKEKSQVKNSIKPC